MSVEPQDYDHLYKIVIVGDASVGKSNLTRVFTNTGFNAIPKPTIGVDFAIKYLEVEDGVVRTHIWDTAGQERFRAVMKRYYTGADGAILAFDLTRPETFMGAASRLEDLKGRAEGKKLSVVLVGNKNDLYAQRAVNMEDINRFCTNEKLTYIETSALTPVNVEAAFQKLCSEIQQKQKRRNIIPTKEYVPVFKPVKHRGCLAWLYRYLFWCR